MPSPTSTAASAMATPDDIKGILGNIDADKMLAIVELRPTIADVEAASSCLAGGADVFGAGEPLKVLQPTSLKSSPRAKTTATAPARDRYAISWQLGDQFNYAFAMRIPNAIGRLND